ncbi:MAG: C25 family cysteine peptidase [Oscillochloridaceae bacterium umkhey_bin13]
MHLRHVGLVSTLLALLLTAQLMPVASRSSAADAAVTPRLLQANASGVRLELRSPSYQLAASGRDQRLSVAGLDQDPAAPGLPVSYAILAVPPTGTVALVPDGLQPQVRRQALRLAEAAILPQGQPLGREGEQTGLGLASSVDLPALDGCSADPVRVTGEAWVRDQRIVTLAFNPVLYCAATEQVRWYPRLTAELRWDEPDLQGQTAPYLPDDPLSAALFPGLLLNADQARQWRQAPGQPDVVVPSQSSQPRYKISLDQPGIYRLSYADLVAAGVPVDTLDPRQLRLTNQDQPVAIHVIGETDGRFDPDDLLFFYGEPVSSAPVLDTVILNGQLTVTETVVSRNYTVASEYTRTNVYWLEVGGPASPRMAVVAATPTYSAPEVEPSSYRATVRAEQQLIWWTHHFTGRDTWFWSRLRSTSSSNAVGTFPITLTAVLAGGSPAGLTAELVPFTSSSAVNPDQRARLSLNGQLLADETWDGITRRTITRDLAVSGLREGVNTLTVTNVLQPGLSNNEQRFDWYAISYDRRFVAEADQLGFSFSANQPQRFRISGLSNGTVVGLEVSNPRAPRWLSSTALTGPEAIFAVQPIGTAQYYVAGATAFRTPLSFTAYTSSNLRATTNGADYLYIAPSSLMTATQTLAAYRAAEGMRTAVIDLQTLIDEFNAGIYHPVAIKRFLAYAHLHWQRPAPQYVLLVGDGHWNFFRYNLGTYGPAPDILMLPNLAWVDPWQGQVDSSNQLAAFVGNDIMPDLVIGRITVRNEAEIANVLAKTQAHETAPPEAAWRRTTTFIADNSPDPAGDFAATLDRVISASVPEPSLRVQRLFLNSYCGPNGQSEPGCPRLVQALTETVNLSGTLTLTYAGHASLNRWAGESFLTSSSAGLLNTTSMPGLVVSLGCLDGYWLHPGTGANPNESLIEILVRQEGGFAAAFSPTGLGLATGHELLASGLFQALFAGGRQRLGPATIAAKLGLFATGRNLDLVDTYTIFGDPALLLAIPDELQPPPTPTTPTSESTTPTNPTGEPTTPTTPTNVTVTPTTPTSEPTAPTTPTTPTTPTGETPTATTTPTVSPGPGELRRVYLPNIGR